MEIPYTALRIIRLGRNPEFTSDQTFWGYKRFVGRVANPLIC